MLLCCPDLKSLTSQWGIKIFEVKDIVFSLCPIFWCQTVCVEVEALSFCNIEVSPPLPNSLNTLIFGKQAVFSSFFVAFCFLFNKKNSRVHFLHFHILRFKKFPPCRVKWAFFWFCFCFFWGGGGMEVGKVHVDYKIFFVYYAAFCFLLGLNRKLLELALL